MSKPSVLFLVAALASAGVAAAQQPPVRKYDDKGAPPFRVLKEGENPPLDANDNFVIGPKYVAAPERKAVDGVPRGKVQQFDVDSKETKLLNPGIARKEFGKVDPDNPKTLIVKTHNIDYKRKITVYIPAQYKPASEARPQSPLGLIEILSRQAQQSLPMFDLQTLSGMEPSRYADALRSLHKEGYITIEGDAPDQTVRLTDSGASVARLARPA